MRWIRLLFRVFGWLLTPLLAWAASFFGAVAGALVALRMDDPIRGLIVTAVCGGLAAFLAIIGWMAYLRRSPEVREALAVTEEGAPDTTEIGEALGVIEETPSPDTTELRIAGLIALGVLALGPHRLEAQTLSGSIGRFYEDGSWNTYRVGFQAANAGIFGVQVHGDLLRRASGAPGGFGGLGADLTAFQSRRRGPYLVAGVSTGIGNETNNDLSKLWASWSAGAGYRLFPLSFLSLGVEGRWREISLGKRDGLELSAGLGLHFGGRGRPKSPSPATPRPGESPSSDASTTPGSRKSGNPVAIPSSDSKRETSRSDSAAESAPLLTLTDSIIATANAAMGRPYKFGGTGADSTGFDCSGLIQYAFGEHGIALPRRSVEQAREGRAIEKRVDLLEPGDLLTFSNRGGRVTHVGLYLGDRRFIHSATRGVQVSVLSAKDPYGRWWYKRWVGVRRIVN